jgi:hypothetical protein
LAGDRHVHVDDRLGIQAGNHGAADMLVARMCLAAAMCDRERRSRQETAIGGIRSRLRLVPDEL